MLEALFRKLDSLRDLAPRTLVGKICAVINFCVFLSRDDWRGEEKMSRSEFDFHHLILLIGTNPLPNFVVADYFLKHNQQLKKIWLIHSEANTLQAGTNIQADNLEKLLKKKWKEEKQHKTLKFPLEKISVSDVSHAKTIRHDVTEKMFKKLGNGSVHLNYTGGTKAMSVHVYWLVKDKMKDNSSCSYLDARKFRLVDDDKDEVIAEDLRREVSISFQELIELHGFERSNNNDIFAFDTSLDIFDQLINKGELSLFYDEAGGYKRKLFENQKGNLAEKTKDLDKGKVNDFTPNDTFISVIMEMPEESRLFTDGKTFNWNISNKNLKKSLKFLDGLWFERYAVKALQEIPSITLLQNWEIRKPGWPTNLYFELDVILLNGYQLTGISCTTDGVKSLCKSKGFEIAHRTRQIGGDEAKAVLITRLESYDKDKLQEELVHDTGGDKNILVLGAEDLKKEKLVSEIKEFIFTKE